MPLSPTHPLAAASPLPYELPEFAKLTPALLAEAIEAGMESERAEWEAIATNPEPPTVANTVEALELTGQLFDRATDIFFNLAGAVGGSEYEQLETELAPKLAAHNDAYWLDERLYQRLRAVDLSDADPETRYMVSEDLKEFERGGIALAAADKERLRELNARLADLQTTFGQKVIAGLKTAAVELSEEEAAGLDESTRAALARTARDAGVDAPYLTTVDTPSIQAIAAALTNPAARAKVHAASVSRGWQEPGDTRELVLQIARLRAERAALLGFDHHAALVAAGETARTTPAVMELLNSLVGPALANLAREAGELADELAAAGEIASPADFAPADWARAEAVAKRRRFALDDEVLRPYFELNRVIEDGVFFAAHELYGLTFTLREDLEGFDETVKIWEVKDEDGQGIGLFVGDYYTRDGKAGGAWMANFVEQSHLTGKKPVVINCQNLVPPPAGQPTLLTFDEVITAFHEFGHALNGLLSNTRYASVAGANTSRDFVELPSQFNENWATHPRVLANYARHYRTGEVLPAEHVARLEEMAKFGQGYATAEYLAAALLDQGWHQFTADQVPTASADVAATEDQLLRAAGLDPRQPVARYRSTYFNHTFGGGYDAGYYAYVWAEVLAADAVAWFRTEGAQGDDLGLNRQAGKRFAAEVLSRGSSRDAMESYRAFAGRAPQVEHLLAKRGLG